MNPDLATSSRFRPTGITPTRWLWILFVGMVMTSACGSAGGPRTGSDFGTDRTGTVLLVVRNLNFAEATLWVHKTGDRIRLGTVSGKGDKEFSLAWKQSLPMQIEIDLMPGDRCITRAMQVDPGDTLELQIELNLEADPDCRPIRR